MWVSKPNNKRDDLFAKDAATHNLNSMHATLPGY